MAWGRTDDAAEPRRGGAAATATVVTTVLAVLTLTGIFIWSSVGDREGGQDDGDGDGAALKTNLTLLLLVIACGMLFVPMKRGWRPAEGSHDTFHIGALAAEASLVGSMFFVSFLSSLNIGGEEGGEGGEEGASPRKVVCILSILLALAYAALSASIYNEGKDLPETGTVGGEAKDQATSAAHLEILSQLYTLISLGTTVLFSILFIVSCVLSMKGEDAELLREEGIVNLILVLLWMVAVSAGAMTAGRSILHEKKLGTLGVGILSGGTAYMALLLFVVSVLYANLSAEEGQEEGGSGPLVATSFVSFFLSLAYLAFSSGIRRYRTSLIGAISGNGSGGGLRSMLFGK